MSDRERWIVYPLLLMALGLALQPKLMPVQFREVTCDKLTCRELVANETIAVVDPMGMPLAELKPTKSGGQFDIVRYSQVTRGPKRDGDIRMFASNGLGDFIPLGYAKLRAIAEPNPEIKQENAVDPSAQKPSENEQP